MGKAKSNSKTDGIIVKNIYKKNKQNNKIQEILLKSYILFLQKEVVKWLQKV